MDNKKTVNEIICLPGKAPALRKELLAKIEQHSLKVGDLVQRSKIGDLLQRGEVAKIVQIVRIEHETRYREIAVSYNIGVELVLAPNPGLIGTQMNGYHFQFEKIEE